MTTQVNNTNDAMKFCAAVATDARFRRTWIPTMAWRTIILTELKAGVTETAITKAFNKIVGSREGKLLNVDASGAEQQFIVKRERYSVDCHDGKPKKCIYFFQIHREYIGFQGKAKGATPTRQ